MSHPTTTSPAFAGLFLLARRPLTWASILTQITVLHHGRMSTQKHPAVLQEIAGIVGGSAAYTLSANYGGQTIQITGKTRRDLAAMLGDQAAGKLAFHFRDASIYVPMDRKATIAARNAEIIRSFGDITRAGQSARSAVVALSKKHTLTERHVWRVLKRAERP